MYCSNCGAKADPGESFCTRCGAPLTEPETAARQETPAQTEAPAPRRRRSPALAVALIAVLILGLGFGAWKLLSPGAEESSGRSGKGGKDTEMTEQGADTAKPEMAAPGEFAPEGPPELSETAAAAACAAAEAFFEAYRAVDPDAGALLLHRGEPEPMRYGALAAAVAQRLDVKVVNTRAGETSVVVDAVVTAPDLGAMLTALSAGDGLPEDGGALHDALLERVAQPDAPTAEFAVEIPAYQVNGTWQLEISSSLANALTGGFTGWIGAQSDAAEGGAEE